MKQKKSHYLIRSSAVFVTAGLLIVSFGSATIVGPLPMVPTRQLIVDNVGTQTVKDLARVGLLRNLSQQAVEDLLSYQAKTGKSLAQILREPKWLQRLGLSANTFKATWYASNPFDLLPIDLQISIRRSKTSFKNRAELAKWLAQRDAPARWREAVDLALIETTPENLWRASRGLKPYARNGQFLQPIVVEKDKGVFDIFDGHIATDPTVIPTNSKVLILVRINGQDRILRVKATDIGQAIKGKHVDLPIRLKPRYGKNHAIRFPGEYIRNPNIVILSTSKKVNPGRKA